MLPNLYIFFLYGLLRALFFYMLLLGHGALVKLFPLKPTWKISVVYLFWCIYYDYICKSFYLADF